MPRSSKYRKTRRHLKDRKRRNTRRSHKQRGGAELATADSWLAAVDTMLNGLNGEPIATLGALIKPELTLTPPTDEERAKAVSIDLPMEISVVDADKVSREDIRDIALRARDIIQMIIGNETPIEAVTPKDFSKSVMVDPNRLDDDTYQDSLTYLLTRENALKLKLDADFTPHDTKAPATTLSEAALNAASPLLIWVLAVNIKGDAQVAMPFASVERALSNVGI